VISGALLGYEPEPFNRQQASAPKGKLRNNSNAVPAYFAGCMDGKCQGGGTVRTERALTHTVRSPFFTGPLRSPSRIQNTFANECFMDELCAQAKDGPLAFRLKHLQDPRMIGVLKAAAEAANWQAPLQKVPGAGDSVVSGRGIACVNYEGDNGYSALIAHVEVDRRTGVVRPKRFVVAVDCGPVSNPDGLRNQTEGGILQGMSRSLLEEVTWNSRHITSVDWVTYKTLYLDYEMPSVEVVIVGQKEGPALGAGELSITLTPAAIGNAIFDATGVRLRTVPFTPERVAAALLESSKGSTS
jgi:CO/xanthine dehydrogenase Mo-binding subunit